jgi:hypothetical protein
MTIIASFMGWWSLLAGLICCAFFWGMWNRIKWDRAWYTPHTSGPPIPERCWTFDVQSLEKFVEHARHIQIGQSASLTFYVQSILKRSDIVFALALSVATVWISVAVIVSAAVWEWLQWAAFPAGAMAILYGVADIAEDLKLAAILGDSSSHLKVFDRADVAAANMLTRIKIVALTLSVVGLAIFLVLLLVQSAIKLGLGTGASSGTGRDNFVHGEGAPA